MLALSQGNGRVHVHVSLTEGEERREYRLCAVCQRVCHSACGSVRVRVRGGGSAIPMTPPLPPNALYYHASIFVEFENVRHYHMHSKAYSNTRSIVYSKESSTIEASLEYIQSNVTVTNTSCLSRRRDTLLGSPRV